MQFYFINICLRCFEKGGGAFVVYRGADPGLLDRGFKWGGGGRFVQFDQFFLKFPMKMKLFRLKRGFVWTSPHPETLWIRHWFMLKIVGFPGFLVFLDSDKRLIC